MIEGETLLRAATEAGPVIVIVLVIYGIAWIAFKAWVKVAEINQRTQEARNAIDDRRNELDEQLQVMFATFAERQQQLDEKTVATQAMVSAQTDASRIAHGTTQSYVERVEKVVMSADDKGSTQRKRIVEAVQENGAKIDAYGAKLGELRQMVDALSAKITNGTVPPEIARMLSQISLKVDECTMAKVSAIESAPPAPVEPITDKTEEKKEG
jgi:hypothetical protein